MLLRLRNNIRAVGDRRAGGIIIPIGKRDKVGTFWNRASDVAWGMFPSKPVFWFHMAESQLLLHAWQRAGMVDQDSLLLLPEGWYAEADINDSPAGNTLWDYVVRGLAAWSTGTLPNLMKIHDSGYVERWPVVELSGAPADKVLSLPGTTTVAAIRSMLPEGDYDDSIELARSPVIMNPPPNGNNDIPALVPASVPVTQVTSDFVTRAEFQAQMSELIQGIASLTENVRALTEAADAPAVNLPPSVPPAGDVVPVQIQVMYEWDELSMFAHTLRAKFDDKAREDTQFMRSYAAKAEKMILQQSVEKDVPFLLRDQKVAIRAMDDEAVTAVQAYMPSIRAAEAMDLSANSANVVETMFHSQAWFAFIMASSLFQQFPRFNMPTSPFKRTKITGGPVVRLIGALTDQANFGVHNSIIPTSKITTGVTTWTAGAIGALTLLEDTLLEDAKVNLWEAFATQYARIHGQALDYTLLNGDETATTSNFSWFSVDPTGTVEDKILAVDGLRHMSLVTDTNGVDLAGAIVNDDILLLMEALGSSGELGLKPEELMLISDLPVFYDIAALSDYKSAADVGPKLSTLVNGFLNDWRGVTTVPVSSAILPNTIASGAIHATTNTLGSVVLTHIPSIHIGIKRELKIERTPVLGTLGSFIFSSMRFDVQFMESNAVAVGYNATI